jgi:hypothetical protein
MIQGSPVYDATPQEKGRHNFEGVVRELTQAIRACDDAGLHMPALMLLYSGIDIMANLDQPRSVLEAGRAGYIRWAEEYLLKDSGLPCNGEDIYAARCGLLHSMALKSPNPRAASARKIVYLHLKDRGLAERLMPVGNPPGCVWVRAEALMDAFAQAMEGFKRRVEADPMKSALVYERAFDIPIFVDTLMPFYPEDSADPVAHGS